MTNTNHSSVFKPSNGNNESGPTLKCTYRAHKNTVNHVDFSVDASKMVTCSSDGEVVFWELVAGTEATRSYSLKGHKDVVHCVNFSPDGSYFVSCSRDRTVCLWRISHDKPSSEPIVYNCHTNTVRYVACSPATASSPDGGEYFATASDDKTVKVWSAGCKNKQIALLRGHKNWVRCCKYCPNDEQLIASCGDDSNIIIHDLRVGTGYSEEMISKSGAKFTSLDWYPGNRYLIAVGSHDGKVRLFDRRTKKTLQCYSAHTNCVNHVNFHSSGNYLISSSDDSTSKILDLLEGRVLYTLARHTGPVTCAKFNSEGKLFSSVGSDTLVNLWSSNIVTDYRRSFDEQILNQSKNRKRISNDGMDKHLFGSNSVDGFDVRAMLDNFNPFKSSNTSPKNKSNSTLDRIVDQLEILAQSLSNLENRVASIEDKLSMAYK
ncbi:proteome of centrioles 1 [Brevipalpus obovatus]|uniref:proteome of centrioles 1 n=1 Tax=Brevipalpus obovatus TaxID=246614 RepID=UPI003D9EA834